MQNALTWFEIPVADLDRAQRFYETVLGRTLRREAFGGPAMAVFPHDEPAPGGCLQVGEPGSGGIRIYLDCHPSIDAAIGRVAAAGGEVTVPKTELPKDLGFIAHLRDTEGNEIGLHARA